MEDDLNFFQLEDDLYFVLGNLGNWFLVCNIVSTQLDEIKRRPHFFLKMEDELNNLFMEDDLNFLENERRPQFFDNGR
jgi:hypothetical protein